VVIIWEVSILLVSILVRIIYFCTTCCCFDFRRQRVRWPATDSIGFLGQIPDLPVSLIDPDTPQDAYTKESPHDPGKTLDLVFSDEFNVEGRTFYPGDDPFWEAVDLWYWPTYDLEWYDPGQITTENGYLKITMEERSVHGMDFVSGMMSSWNKFCFTGGYIEGTSAARARSYTFA
jgi:hypothetical protein